MPELETQIEQIERESGGKLCFAVKNLTTGKTISRLGDTHCKTASIIKLPILVHCACAVREGGAAWNEPMTLVQEEKVAGSGVLTHLSAGLTLTLRDIATLMTILSDNTGTNMLIDRLGVAPINERMRGFGLTVTTLFRKSYQPDSLGSSPYGLGVTTPNEMLRLMELLAAYDLGDAETCVDILNILGEQQYRNGIPRMLPHDWKYAGKTGAVNACRNDVGLVTTPDGRRWILSLFCQDLDYEDWTDDNPALLAIARLSRLLTAG